MYTDTCTYTYVSYGGKVPIVGYSTISTGFSDTASSICRWSMFHGGPPRQPPSQSYHQKVDLACWSNVIRSDDPKDNTFVLVSGLRVFVCFAHSAIFISVQFIVSHAMSFLTHFPLPPMPHFLQITQHDLLSTGANNQVCAIQCCVDRYKKQIGNITVSISLPKTPASSVPLSTNFPSHHQLSSTITTATALSSRKNRKLNVSLGIDSQIRMITKAREDALDKIPTWLDCGKTVSTLLKRKKEKSSL